MTAADTPLPRSFANGEVAGDINAFLANDDRRPGRGHRRDTG
jgi:hypothetical protein